MANKFVIIFKYLKGEASAKLVRMLAEMSKVFKEKFFM